jgi:hypothetical protein
MSTNDKQTFAEVVDVSRSLARLPLALQNDVLDLRVVGADEQLGAVEADAAEDLDGLDEEAGVEHRFREILSKNSFVEEKVEISWF